MHQANHKKKRIAILILCVAVIITFLNFSSITIFNIENHNRSLKAEPVQIDGQCFVLEPTNSGLFQWGNAVVYYLSGIMYLLRNGATGVFMESKQGNNPIGVLNLDGVGYGPKVSSITKSDCITVDPRYLGPNGSGKRGESHVWGASLQDLMDLRNGWKDDTKSWPGLPFNPNPFVSDFGIEPSIQDVQAKLGIDWDDILVIHIRQGDAMWLANRPGPKALGHSQPPCAFYEDVVETGYNGGPFPYFLIVTNKVKDEVEVNPCYMYMVDKYRSGQQKTKLLDYDMIFNRMHTVDSHAGKAGENEGMRIDLYLLSQAVNVAEGHSTFTMGTTLLNYNLKRHFFVANPATINTVPIAMYSLAGNMIHARHFYTPGVEQTQYILNEWLGNDASCKFYDRVPMGHNKPHGNIALGYWIHNAGKISESWDKEGTNFNHYALAYNRTSLMKWKTSDKHFQCESVEFLKDDPTWFIPCICN